MREPPTDMGLCPGCEEPGPVATACTRMVCSRRELHFIPPEHIGRTAPDPLVGRLVESYLVVRLLGAGGFGKVYLALQLPILMRAAVKILHRSGDDAEEQKRVASKFLAEGRALATLTHPNIVRLLQFGAFDDTAYLAMEYVDAGVTLRDLMVKRAAAAQPLTVGEVGPLLKQLMDALEAAHSRGIVHRDVKPENIMVQSVSGHPLFVRVLDFGLAKFVSEHTETSAAIGTPVYMAPEQVMRRHIGPWTDVYAVGALAFELLTGRRPYAGDSVHEIFAKKLDAEGDPLADVIEEVSLPPDALAFFRKVLAFEHTDRYADIPALRAALEPILRGFEQPAGETRPVASSAGAGHAIGATASVGASTPALVAAKPLSTPLPMPTPESLDSSPTRLEASSEEVPLQPTPPRPTDTVDPPPGVKRTPRRARTSRARIAVIALCALFAAGVIIAVATWGSGPQPAFAKRMPAGTTSYVRIADVRNFREQMFAGSFLKDADAVQKALAPMLAKPIGEAAEALGVHPDLIEDLLAHTRTLELAGSGAGMPAALLHLTDGAVATRIIGELGASAQGDDRWSLAGGSVSLARVGGDAIIVGPPSEVERALHPPERSMADDESFRTAWDGLAREGSVFTYNRMPRLPPSIPLPQMDWFAMAGSPSGAFTIEVALPPTAPMSHTLVRPARRKALAAGFPLHTVLSLSASVDGAGARTPLTEWIDALPEGPARRLNDAIYGSAGPISRVVRIVANAPLPVASEVVAALVLDETGRLGPLVAFDLPGDADAAALATQLFRGHRDDAKPWLEEVVDGTTLHYMNAESWLRTDSGPLPADLMAGYEATFDTTVGWTARDGVFLLGGVQAMSAWLATRAGRMPRVDTTWNLDRVDRENALQIDLQVGDFANGVRSGDPGLADAQSVLASLVRPDASAHVSLRLEPTRLRVRSDAPLAVLGILMVARERAAAALLPDPSLVPEPTVVNPPTLDPIAPAPPDPSPTPLVGEALTDAQLTWPLETSRGDRTTLAELSRDKLTLVTFWFSECQPCINQLRGLDAVGKRLGANWQIVNIANDTTWAASRALYDQPGQPLPSLDAPFALRDAIGDGTNGLATTFNIRQMPESIIVYRGRLLDHFNNAQEWTNLQPVARLLACAERAGVPAGEPTDAERAEFARFASGGNLAFSDTFEGSALSSSWSTTSGWSVADGHLTAAIGAAVPLWLTLPLPDPVRVELTVTSPGSTICGIGGDQSSVTFDGMVIHGGGVAGAFDALGNATFDPERTVVRPTTWSPTRTYRWVIVRNGLRVFWALDGELRLVRYEPTPLAGSQFVCLPLGVPTLDDVSVYTF